jgi:DNA-binding beta-propeller fold protein YncE
VRHIHILLSIILSISFFACKGQKSFGSDQLILKRSIPLSNVSGRIDHIDVNLKQQVVYVASFGNNSLEIVDLNNGKVIGSIKKLDAPQGVACIPETNEIIVANGGNGNCDFYNTNNFQRVGSVALGSDADNVRYDSIGKKIYVGYGDGGIAVIDAIRHQKIADIKLPAHPEGFQLDRQMNKIFVNVPDAGQIDVVDLKTLSVADKWKTKYNANFPMAIDEMHHIIFIGYRHPGKLVAMNANNGKIISEIDLVGDADDLFFDERNNKIYASGGGGSINVFAFNGATLKKTADIPVRNGARTSLLVPSYHLFILAERAGGGKGSQLDIFDTGE